MVVSKSITEALGEGRINGIQGERFLGSLASNVSSAE